jgi:hypothetical protein
MVALRFSMFVAADLHDIYWTIYFIKKVCKYTKNMSYAQSTFNDKTSNDKININHMFFLVRRMVNHHIKSHFKNRGST